MQLKLNIISIYREREMGNKSSLYFFDLKKAEIFYIEYVYCHHYLVALDIRTL